MVRVLNPELRHRIERNTGADSHMCWACSSCDSECPMNIATNRLRPQKMIRLANLGFFEELACAPEIWYCLTCRRCNDVCPNRVKPASVIAFARMEAVRTGLVSYQRIQSYKELFAKFQRVRWHVTAQCLSGKLVAVDDAQWDVWLETPVPESTSNLSGRNLFQNNGLFHELVEKTRGSVCFTCGECSSACPISGNRSVFDPRFLFRMANLGILDELLKSPSIWLCLDCGRCTEACSQLVDGRRIIQTLQELAIQSGAVDPDFPLQLQNQHSSIYLRFLQEIDGLLFSQDSCGERHSKYKKRQRGEMNFAAL